MKTDSLRFFQLLADETRLRSVLLIYAEQELCVCELVHALGTIQPKVSRHLAALREAGVLVDRREGQWIYYRLSERLPDWAAEIIESASRDDAARRLLRRDLATLKKMTNRPDSRRCA
jgi:ArsR family transcriptional regulator